MAIGGALHVGFALEPLRKHIRNSAAFRVLETNVENIIVSKIFCEGSAL